MKQHYDFSNAERGKFYRKGARVRLPIYLDGRLQKRLERIAQKKGRDVGDVVSALLMKTARARQTQLAREIQAELEILRRPR